MENIWFTADTHYHHKNIVRGTTSWDQEEVGSSGLGIQRLRDFDTLEEHDEALVENINSLVKPNDILYHLGDWSFGGYDQIPIFRKKLNVKRIHLILGNHDQHIEKRSSPYRNLFESVEYIKQISFKIDSQVSGRYGKTNLFLSHYSHQVWDKSHHGAIHLFGHSHGSLAGVGRSMDVGVDTHDLYPYHLEEIVDIFKTVKPHEIDHHNERTN